MHKNPILFISTQTLLSDSRQPDSWHKEFRQQGAHITDVNAQDALACVTSGCYHLLLFNADCATSDVVELCARLRQRFQTPLLVVVPSTDDGFLLQLYQAGASECISPSIPPSLLAAKVSSWLRWAIPPQPDAQTPHPNGEVG